MLFYHVKHFFLLRKHEAKHALPVIRCIMSRRRPFFFFVGEVRRYMCKARPPVQSHPEAARREGASERACIKLHTAREQSVIKPGAAPADGRERINGSVKAKETGRKKAERGDKWRLILVFHPSIPSSSPVRVPAACLHARGLYLHLESSRLKAFGPPPPQPTRPPAKTNALLASRPSIPHTFPNRIAYLPISLCCSSSLF